MKVTENDFRIPEFRDANPDDYEFRDGDKKIVRKDRWKTGMMQIASACNFDLRAGFEIPDVVMYIEILVKDVHSWTDVDDELPDDNKTVDVQTADGSILMNTYFHDGVFARSGMRVTNVTKWRYRMKKVTE